MNIEELFPDGQFASDGGEYVISCPYCDDSSAHCYINLEKRLFYCHKCEEKGLLSTLLKYCGLEREARVQFWKKRDKVVFKPPVPINIGDFPRVCSHGGMLDDMALTYLTRRGFTAKEIVEHDIRYGQLPPWYGRVIFPIYEGKEFVCLSARAYMPGAEPRYLFPAKGQTRLKANEIVYFAGGDILDDTKFVIVEGVIDAISVQRKLPKGFCALATLSHSIGLIQLAKIMALGEGIEIYLMFDPDSMKENLRSAKTFSDSGRKAYICRLTSKDPDEAPEDEIRKAIAEATPYSFDIHSRITIEG